MKKVSAQKANRNKQEIVSFIGLPRIYAIAGWKTFVETFR